MKALLLDLDGTVADTHGLIVQCYQHAIQTHLGEPGLVELWRECVGLPLFDLIARTYQHYGRPLSPSLLEEVVQTYRAAMRANCDTIQAFPGIPETLEELRLRGVRLAIVTTKYHAMAVRHLETLGLTDYFEAVIAGDHCTHHKPHPEPFLKGLQALNLPPDAVYGVGDSVHDIQSARGAGLITGAALWGAEHPEALLEVRPDAVYTTPNELLERVILAT